MDNEPGSNDKEAQGSLSNNESFILWNALAGENRRFLHVVGDNAFWQVPFPQRLALLSWGAFAANLIGFPFAYYFIQRMHYKGALVLACWLAGLAMVCLAEAAPPRIALSVICGLVLGHLASYDHYRHVRFKEQLWPWVPEFCGTPWGAGCTVAGAFVFLMVSAAGVDSESRGSDMMFALSIFVMLGVVLVVYFVPTMVAFKRVHPNRWAIFVINFCFGSTGIGWLGALIWALHKVHDPGDGRSAGGESGLNLFVNDTKIVELKVPLNEAFAPSGNAGIADLEKLAGLFERGLLSEQEYSSQKKRILKELHPD
jgi:Superinfection immunity protein